MEAIQNAERWCVSERETARRRLVQESCLKTACSLQGCQELGELTATPDPGPPCYLPNNKLVIPNAPISYSLSAPQWPMSGTTDPRTLCTWFVPPEEVHKQWTRSAHPSRCLQSGVSISARDPHDKKAICTINTLRSWLWVSKLILHILVSRLVSQLHAKSATYVAAWNSHLQNEIARRTEFNYPLWKGGKKFYL